jgi:hypothetical protein
MVNGQKAATIIPLSWNIDWHIQDEETKQHFLDSAMEAFENLARGYGFGADRKPEEVGSETEVEPEDHNPLFWPPKGTDASAS